MINGLDLFSGIGGITVALQPWVSPVVYCEKERYAQAVLLSRMADGFIPRAPIWDDVRTLGRDHFDLPIDIIYGGFPCQDISIAGHGKGLAGERSGLFYEIARLTDTLRPAFVFIENTPAITTRGGLQVIESFTQMGYDCRWCVIPSGYGTEGFKGERFFLLTKAQSAGLPEWWQSFGTATQKPRPPYQGDTTRLAIQTPTIEPSICGTPYGLPRRMDRIKCLGNAVVPHQVRRAFIGLLKGFE